MRDFWPTSPGWWQARVADPAARRRVHEWSAANLPPELRQEQPLRRDLNRAVLIPYLINRDRGRCQITRCLFSDRRIRATTGPSGPSIDHIIPLSMWGADDGPDPDCLENLQLAHFRCNASKGNRHAGQLLLIG